MTRGGKPRGFMLARLGPADQGGGTHTAGNGVLSVGGQRTVRLVGRSGRGQLDRTLRACSDSQSVGGSARLSASGEHGPRLPHPRPGVFDHAERRRVATLVIDAVSVEQVDVGEGAMAGRAVRALDAVPAMGAAGTGHRQPGGLVLGHHRSVRPPADRKSRSDAPAPATASFRRSRQAASALLSSPASASFW